MADSMNYITLDYKPAKTFEDADGKSDKALDLLVKTWSIWPYVNFVSPIIVNEYYVARPDLISLAVYGTDKYGDMICKFNGISNPFELNEGMVIQIPPLSWAQEGTENREHYQCEVIKEEETIKKYDNIKALPNEYHTSSTIMVNDPPPYIIDKTYGLVIY